MSGYLDDPRGVSKLLREIAEDTEGTDVIFTLTYHRPLIQNVPDEHLHRYAHAGRKEAQRRAERT